MARAGVLKVDGSCHCGGIGYEAEVYPAKVGGGRRVVALRVGTLSQRDRLIPRDQYWCRSAQSWLPQLPRIEKRDRQPVSDDKGDFGEKG